MLVDNKDGTVTDTKTGLMWQQGEIERMTWGDAATYCESLSIANHNDWRLPDTKELRSLVDHSEYNPTVDTVAFPGAVSDYYWSSTTYAYNSNYAWVMSFHNSYEYYYYKAYSCYARAVRTIE